MGRNPYKPSTTCTSAPVQEYKAWHKTARASARPVVSALRTRQMHNVWYSIEVGLLGQNWVILCIYHTTSDYHGGLQVLGTGVNSVNSVIFSLTSIQSDR